MPLRKKTEKISLDELYLRASSLSKDVNIYYNPDNLLSLVLLSDNGKYVDENDQPIRVRRVKLEEFQKIILNTISREKEKQIKLF